MDLGQLLPGPAPAAQPQSLTVVFPAAPTGRSPASVSACDALALAGGGAPGGLLQASSPCRQQPPGSACAP